jgi:hypothetical protein
MTISKDDWKPFSNLEGQCRLVLAVDWDPLGVFGLPGSLGQYDRYVAGLLELLHARAPHSRICNYLRSIQQDQMEMPLNEEKIARVSKRLCNIADTFNRSEWGTRT